MPISLLITLDKVNALEVQRVSVDLEARGALVDLEARGALVDPEARGALVDPEARGALVDPEAQGAPAPANANPINNQRFFEISGYRVIAYFS